jgi:hypothetical protein
MEEALADSTQETILQFRRASADYWSEVNPILYEGEPGYVTDTKRHKIGDGVTAWNDLKYEFDTSYNYIINGGFDVWQRGDSFTNVTNVPGSFCADRWRMDWTSGSNAVFEVSRQELEPETIHKVSQSEEFGYEGKYFLRYDLTTKATNMTETQRLIRQPIEDVRTFSNQYVTMSFYARADIDSINSGGFGITTNRDVTFSLEQNFGVNGSLPYESYRATATLTSEWQRYSETFFIPSIEGRTVGESSYINATIFLPVDNYGTDGFTIDIWGIQVEASEVVGRYFKRNSNSFAGELAACQRYYSSSASTNREGFLNYTVTSISANANYNTVYLPATMRGLPSVRVGTSFEYPASDNWSRVIEYNGGLPFTAVSDKTVSSFSFYLLTSPTAVGNRLRYQWQADAELGVV